MSLQKLLSIWFVSIPGVCWRVWERGWRTQQPHQFCLHKISVRLVNINIPFTGHPEKKGFVLTLAFVLNHRCRVPQIYGQGNIGLWPALRWRHNERNGVSNHQPVYSTVYSGEDQRKHQSSVSLAFVRGIPRWSVNSPHKWPVTRKIFPFNGVIMCMFGINAI